MPSLETFRHRELKRLALAWVGEAGFKAAAVEVSLPSFGAVVDVAAYRAQRRGKSPHPGATAIFECKQARSDFLTDSRRSERLLAHLERLHVRRARIEEVLRLHYPHLRNGDSLFAEYETHDFPASGDELYLRVLRDVATLSRQLHRQTKFEELSRRGAANLMYVVAEPNVVRAHELPDGWGLLVREGEALALAVKPVWREVAACQRLHLLQRIAMSGTRAVHREHGVVISDLRRARSENP
ncbi:MAG: hypothetical protein ABI680_03010 [Chthoniobacteraceae bacterium]